MTLNYTSTLWMTLFLVGSASVFGSARVDNALVVAAVLGFSGVVFVLRPTIEQGQLWSGLGQQGSVGGVEARTAPLGECGS